MICRRCEENQQLGEREATELWHCEPVCDECYADLSGQPVKPRPWVELVLPLAVSIAFYLIFRWLGGKP